MKIAILGAGDVGSFLARDYHSISQAVVVLARTPRSGLETLGIEVRITDYSVPSLVAQFSDCDAVISTLSGPSDFYIASHSAVLEACRQSPRCNRFLPSEWNVNIKDFPDQPMITWEAHETIRNSLRAQTEVKCTLVCQGWFMDYILPTHKRTIRDLGRAWPMDYGTKVFYLYGDGQQKVTLTSLLDTSRAVLHYIIQDESPSWQEHLEIAGHTLTYKQLFEEIYGRDKSWSTRRIDFSTVFNDVKDGSKEDSALDHRRILSFTRANEIPAARALKWGEGVLQEVQASPMRNSWIIGICDVV